MAAGGLEISGPDAKDCFGVKTPALSPGRYVMRWPSVWISAAQPAVEDAVTWVEVAPIVISALALVVAVVLGLRNRGTSKKALRLAERQEERRNSRIDLYINDSIEWKQTAARVVGIHAVVANPTDGPTSLVHAELHVTYDLGGTVTTIRIRAETSDPTGLPPGVASLELPARLDANDAVSGWLLFLLKDGLTGDRPVERYDLIARDVHGKEESVQLGVFREGPSDQAEQDEG